MTTTHEIAPALAFDVEVASVVRLSPSFVRVTFAGPSLARFHAGGPLGTRDLRIKVIIPSAGRRPTGLGDLSDGWYQRWLAMDPEERGSMRTYTVRRARVSGADPQVDVDFVLHLDGLGRGGPASTWASEARVGDRVTLIGPNAGCEGYGGIEWQPHRDDSPRRPVRLLLAGDETAVPAISSVLESLPAGSRGHAVLEVPGADDFQRIATSAGVEVTWLARGARPHGRLLTDAVRGILDASPPGAVTRSASPLDEVDIDSEILWETPGQEPVDDSDFYAWIAGEAAMVRELRRYLVRDRGVDRRKVAFMGYWRQGRAETV